MNKITLNNDNFILNDLSLRDYFASQAMLAIMQETQEMRIASFWDWCKQLASVYLNFTFLVVRYVKVENVYEDAAKRAYEYADMMLIERMKSTN